MHDPRFDTVARWVVKPLAAVLYPAEEFAPVPEAVWMSCVTDEQLATAECGGEHNLTVWLSEAYSLYSGAQGAVPVSVREGCRGVVRETSDPTSTTPTHAVQLGKPTTQHCTHLSPLCHDMPPRQSSTQPVH